MKEDILEMSYKERQRKAMVEAIKNKHFTVREAAERLDITDRQMRRILRRFECEGDKGLIHRHRGQPSNHAIHLKHKTIILELYQAKYMGFGPTLAAEKMTEEDKYPTHPETLRRWLKAAQLWDEKRKRAAYRKQRKRREQFGDLLQLDGSFHHWFGEDHPTACLMNLVDDATGTTMALMDKEETTEGAMRLLMKWIKRYGIPKSIYVDLKTVYISPKTLVLNDELNGLTAAFTHFSKACDRLGIKIIKAYSPQAKGRVERKHAVFQDRFVKELRLKNFKTIQEANQLLENKFLAVINKKFAIAPADTSNAHREAALFGDLQQIFCWEYTRQVQNDWTISFERQCYQIEKNHYPLVKAKQTIIVRQHLNKKISLWQGNNRLSFKTIESRPKSEVKIKKGTDGVTSSKIARANKHKTPWGQYNPGWLAKKVAYRRPGSL